MAQVLCILEKVKKLLEDSEVAASQSVLLTIEAYFLFLGSSYNPFKKNQETK